MHVFSLMKSTSRIQNTTVGEQQTHELKKLQIISLYIDQKIYKIEKIEPPDQSLMLQNYSQFGCTQGQKNRIRKMGFTFSFELINCKKRLEEDKKGVASDSLMNS